MSTVLVVDDDRVSQAVLAKTLAAEGYRTELASDGEAALISVAARSPDLVLLDICMPGIDGFEVCRRLKADGPNSRVPVIFLSATSDPKERVEGFRLGAVDFIAKPFQREELLARVGTHLMLARLQGDVERQRDQLQLANQQLQSEMAERAESVRSLQRSEERLNLTLDAAQMGTWEMDLAANAVWRSRRHDQIFGYEVGPAHWTQATFIQHVVPEDRPRLEQEITESFRSGRVRSECRIIRAGDQAERWIRIQGKVYFDTEGKPVRLMGIVVDITDQKLAEQERQAAEVQTNISQKLESVGRLASGIAHEINTPAQFISDNIQFLKGAVASMTDVLGAYRGAKNELLSGNDVNPAIGRIEEMEANNELDYLLAEIPRAFDETVSGLQRVTQIIKSLKEFAHPGIASKQPGDLNRAIVTTVAVSRHEWKYVAELETYLDPDLPAVPVVIDEINQVMLNLIVNAAHAISDAIKVRGEAKGVISIRTSNRGDHVLVEVEDNGTGIPDSARPHIFEPFFTTKGVGKGTGQGLAIVRTIIVKNHGGDISYRTEPGRGTTFSIRLPMARS